MSSVYTRKSESTKFMIKKFSNTLFRDFIVIKFKQNAPFSIFSDLCIGRCCTNKSKFQIDEYNKWIVVFN